MFGKKTVKIMKSSRKGKEEKKKIRMEAVMS